jgi:hypothetical protein
MEGVKTGFWSEFGSAKTRKHHLLCRQKWGVNTSDKPGLLNRILKCAG